MLYLSMINLLLNGAGGEQSIDAHVASLPDAPRPLTRLRVYTA